MDELAALYPDSAEVLQLRTDLARERDDALGRLAERYGQLVAEGRLVADPDAEDVPDVRAIVARIDPAHPMLEDPRLATRYVEVARAAMDAGEWERARSVLAGGVEVTGGSAELGELRARVDGELSRQAAARRVAELEAVLSGRAWSSLSDFDEVRGELLELQALRPLHEALSRARPRLAEAFGNAFAGLLGAGDAVRAQRRLVGYASLLGTDAVRGYRERLEAAGAPEADAPEVDARVERVRGLLASASSGETGPQDAAWSAHAGAAYRELVALAGEGSPAVSGVRGPLSALYLERARALGAGERFDEALALVARGDALVSGGEPFAAEREALRGHAGAGRVAQARAVLETLRGESDAGDAFVAAEGPRLIAGAHLERARAASGRGDAESV